MYLLVLQLPLLINVIQDMKH